MFCEIETLQIWVFQCYLEFTLQVHFLCDGMDLMRLVLSFSTKLLWNSCSFDDVLPLSISAKGLDRFIGEDDSQDMMEAFRRSRRGGEMDAWCWCGKHPMIEPIF
ncbi:uncharacterized protein LOC121984343 [Zingiber officinale]|uniref:uncharacterized protein LOC121984343 n=1 Tax=Zingiber officinale TaxID=94328 RepID=UPI001C4B5477|nr:uncharacterized protein LOC121984343 [Zingiber officinale]